MPTFDADMEMPSFDGIEIPRQELRRKAVAWDKLREKMEFLRTRPSYATFGAIVVAVLK